MKQVCCVDVFDDIAYGKVYEIHSTYSSDEDGYDIVYVITNDNQVIDTYSEHDFVSIDDWRDIKLKELGL